MRSPDTSSLLPMVARGLTYTAGGRPVVDAVDLSLSGQGISVVMGENGAGKTVLVRLLHGLLQPTAGEVSWGGRPMNQDLRRRQAMVFQTPVLLRRSVAANIDFVLESKGAERRARRQEILASAGLADKASQPARLLSGGERQRLAVARALATEPEILFLDEPTASLDPASVLAIEAAVTAARARGVKMVFITHDIGQAKRLADDVVFMHRGRILEHTAASAFFDRPASRQAEDYLAGRIVL